MITCLTLTWFYNTCPAWDVLVFVLILMVFVLVLMFVLVMVGG